MISTTLHQIGVNLNDARVFGPRFLLRHFPRSGPHGEIALPLHNGESFVVRRGNSDIEVIRQVFARRDYDTAAIPNLHDRLAAKYASILASGKQPLIIDAGANIGASARWFVDAYPRAGIAAVEPDPDNYRMLKANTASCPQVTPIEAAVGSVAGHVNVSSGAQGWAVQTARADSAIPILPIDVIAAQFGGTELFIVKIDIEEFEDDLFETALDWLDRCYMVVVEPHDWMLPGRHTSRTMQRAMAVRPFEIFLKNENLFFCRFDPA